MLATAGIPGADCILADLGASSMQLDDPSRGFSLKHEGPLDMRMNPQRNQTAAALLEKTRPDALAKLLVENADEPHARPLADALAGRHFATTTALAAAIRAALPHLNEDARELSVRRVFQALRIAVNDEFSALDAFLRHLPGCLNPGGRAAILTFSLRRRPPRKESLRSRAARRPLRRYCPRNPPPHAGRAPCQPALCIRETSLGARRRLIFSDHLPI